MESEKKNIKSEKKMCGGITCQRLIDLAVFGGGCGNCLTKKINHLPLPSVGYSSFPRRRILGLLVN